MKNRKTLKKLILGSFFLLGSTSLFAQTQKVHTLQAKNTSTSTTMNSDALIQMDSNNKGLLLPRIALTGANQVAPLTAHTAGMVVYNTATVVATATIEAVTPGYYYNNGTKWVKIADTDTADITNDAWINNTATNVVELATKSDGTARIAGTEMVITDTGNVGIGTTTPVSKLSLYNKEIGKNIFKSVTENSDGGGMDDYAFQTYGSNPYMTFFMNAARGTAASPQALQTDDHIFNLSGTANGIIVSDYEIKYKGTGTDALSTTRFANSNSTAIFIKENNNIGINTENPVAKLEVNGTTTEGYTRIFNDGNDGDFVYSGGNDAIYYFINKGANAGLTSFNSNLQGNLLVIRNEGNVGIGTATPNEKLSVNGHITLGTYEKAFASTSADLGWGNRLFFNGKKDNSDPLFISRYNVINDGSELRAVVGDVADYRDGFSIGVQGNNINDPYSDDFISNFTVRGNGYVGIGTSTPQATLHIEVPTYGYTNIGSSGDFSYSGGDDSIYWFRHKGDLTGRTAFLNSSDLELLTIRNNGNIGIGVITPSQKLEVAGKVKAAGFMVGATNLTVPDYVFEKYYQGFSELNNNYTFKALPEVEEFIKKNGHLPGYVSAKEVAKAKSFDMTATQLTNIEKIEELYLHTIEQDKKLKAQQQQIEKLEALVVKLMEAKK